MTRETGPRPKTVLTGLNYHGEDFDSVFRSMRAEGSIVKYGKRKDAKWGAPGWVRPQRRRFQ